MKSLTEIFVDESKKNELRGIRGVMEFSNEQLEIYKQKVQETERKLQELKERQASAQVQKIGLDANSVMQLRQLISSSESAIADRQRKLADLQSQLGLPTIDLLWERDTRLQQVKSRIEAKMADFKKSAIATGLQTDSELTLDSEVNVLRQEYNRLLSEIVARVYPTLTEGQQAVMAEYQLGQIDLYIFRARSQVAGDLLNRFAQMSTAAPASEIEAQRIEAELQQNRRIYEVFLEQSRGSQIEEALQNSDADFKYSVIEAANMPVEPVGGSKKAFVLGAFGVSVILGLSLVVVLELSDQSIRNVKDVEQLLAAPVWGVIPKIGVSFQVWQQNLAQAYKGGTSNTSASRTARNTKMAQTTSPEATPSTQRKATQATNPETTRSDSTPQSYARVTSVKTSQQEFHIRSGGPPKVVRRGAQTSANPVAPATKPGANPAPEAEPIFVPRPPQSEKKSVQPPLEELPPSTNGVDKTPPVPPEEPDQWIV
ncbi:hypothetical protein HUU05_10785 [candidate division KSB1 bacterium]|nr:hypothetical protein [candidate division KSB1 bacterium]